MKVDWIVLADHAEVVLNKLYLMGGGWEHVTVPGSFPTDHRFTVAIAFLIPWEETNQLFDIEIELIDPDGTPVVQSGGQLEAGRPAGMPSGHEQRAQITATIHAPFNQPGLYSVAVKIQGEESKRSTFYVVQAQQMVIS